MKSNGDEALVSDLFRTVLNGKFIRKFITYAFPVDFVYRF
jgi:hypothetical protein